ncbi:protein of unknown function [Candidatus Filomicrobium marinum]|uniref:Uncharacterized protein n=1 Tax=Candidatus Filomicrobium marinum TaxID=1608628 RepID=A0A0D6JBW9_9HYPH|nr:protein of unknown function [Candidatus Filomicrobium marinum]CPR16094.1 protein of unknown function [Candidatus Filomicrobium marinum]
MTFGEPITHSAFEGDLAATYGYLDVRSINVGVVAKTITDVFTDTIIRAGIVFWTPSPEPVIHFATPLSLLTPEPRSNFIASSLKKATVFIAMTEFSAIPA